MMKVIRQENSPKIIHFDDLHIGDVYRDEVGCICIKISDNCVDNSLTYGYDERPDEWGVTSEDFNAEVTPIEAELVIK